MAKPTPTLPQTMCAVVLQGVGDYDQYTYAEDVPVPQPAQGEVLVQVDAAALNNTDLNTRIDWYAGGVDEDGLTFPRIQGADVCGTIAAAGEGVDERRVGERVICDPRLPVGRDHGPNRSSRLLGYDVDGGFARYTVVPAANAWTVRADLDPAELAAYPTAYSTALELILRSRAVPLETMLVTGASGGVGAAVVQLGKLFNLTVLAVAAAGKADRVRALGADQVIRRGSDLSEALGDAGVTSLDLVLDLVGGEPLRAAVDLIRPGGRCLTAGTMAGPIAPVDLRTLIYRDIQLRGVSQASSATFAKLIRLVDAGAIRAPIEARFPLRELVAAQRQFAKREHVGKIVLTVG